MGPDRGKHLRNIAIVVLLALAVWLLPGGGAASATLNNVLTLIFLGGALFFAYRIYMERREVILGLEERQRGILYGALALGTITLVATARLWAAGNGAGAIVWLLFMVLAVYALFSVYRAYREY